MITKTFSPTITNEFRVGIRPINWIWIPIGVMGLLFSKWLQPSLGPQSTKIWIGIYSIAAGIWFALKIRFVEFNGSVVTLKRLGNEFPKRYSHNESLFPDVQILVDDLKIFIHNNKIRLSDGSHSYLVTSGSKSVEFNEWLNKQGLIHKS